jgi:hypothetical protein
LESFIGTLGVYERMGVGLRPVVVDGVVLEEGNKIVNFIVSSVKGGKGAGGGGVEGCLGGFRLGGDGRGWEGEGGGGGGVGGGPARRRSSVARGASGVKRASGMEGYSFGRVPTKSSKHAGG